MLELAAHCSDRVSFWEAVRDLGLVDLDVNGEPLPANPSMRELDGLPMIDWSEIGDIQLVWPPVPAPPGPPPVMRNRFFVNFRFFGTLEQELTAGLEQFEADGDTQKYFFDRTHFVDRFSSPGPATNLTNYVVDPHGSVRGFEIASVDLKFYDTAEIKDRYNVWA